MSKYRCKITKTREVNHAFAVMVIAVPSLPDDKPCKDIVRIPLLAVIAANDDGGKWGFVNLNQDEKHCIGDMLLDLEIPVGEWVYCELYESHVVGKGR